MNGRFRNPLHTPEAQLGAVCGHVVREKEVEHPTGRADDADFAAAMQPYLHIMLLTRELETVNRCRNGGCDGQQDAARLEAEIQSWEGFLIARGDHA